MPTTLKFNETITEHPPVALDQTLHVTPQTTPVQLVSNQPRLAETSSILRTSASTSVFRPVATFAVPVSTVFHPGPPLLLNSISYTLPLGSSIRTAQGQDFAVSVQFHLTGPATNIAFTCSGLPAGVTFQNTSVSFAANITRRIFLHFTVSPTIDIMAAKPFAIHYAGYPGPGTGVIPMTVEIWSGFPMQHQLESNWCWAAVSTSFAHYYSMSSTVTQCQVVNQQLNRSDACTNGSSAVCNQGGYLDQALSFVQHLDHAVGSTESYATIVAQNQAFTPLGVRVAWSGGGAHFIAATGVEQNNLVIIDDPIYGTSVVNYSTLFGTYQGSGSWTTSYFTKR